MKVAYFDCTSGVSGNMIVGAFIDAGMPVSYLDNEISKILKKENYKLIVKKITIFSSEITYFNTEETYNLHNNDNKINYLKSSEAKNLIMNSNLSNDIKDKLIEIFSVLITAKAKAHKCHEEEVNFKYEGLVDTIIDILGAIVGLKYFNINKVISTPLQVGGGTLKIREHEISIPAPMTKIILDNIPTYSTGLMGEMVTPTGAAIVATISDEFKFIKNGELKRIGYGLATKNARIEEIFKIIM